MARRWPKNAIFTRVPLEVEDRRCSACGRAMRICDHRHHRIYTFGGPLHLVCKLVHFPKRSCPNHRRTFAPEAELALTMPLWMIGWLGRVLLDGTSRGWRGVMGNCCKHL